MPKSLMAVLGILTASTSVFVPSAFAQSTTDPLGVSSASSTASSFAVTSETGEQRLRRTAVYVAQMCNGRRLAARRECDRIAGIIDRARAKASAGQAASRP